MAATANSRAGSLFRGSALARLDAKGRLTLPRFVRDTMQARSGIRSVVLARHRTKPCLIGGADESEFLGQFSRAEVPSTREADGPYPPPGGFGAAQSIPWSPGGRIVLPQWLRELAGMEDSILFVGTGKVFEMWDTAAAANSSEDSLRQLAARHLRRQPP